MKRISSRLTFLLKRVWPMLKLGLLVGLLALIATLIRPADVPLPLILLVPVLVAIIGILRFKNLIPDLADGVWDMGNALIIRNKGEEDRILFSDITTVGYSAFMRLPRVTLQLRTPSRFGNEISFFGPVDFLSSSGSRIDKLIVRIDAARRQAR